MLKENNENNLGVFRSEDLLKNALSKTLEIFNQFRKYRIKNKNLIWNQEIIEYFELESLLFNSIATNFSAINRRESRGSHYRFDFPQRDDNNFLAHSLVRIVDFNEIKLDFSLKKVKNHSSIKELNLTVQKRNY
jgi:succinate dehydrogenase / fumarate reductase flavoprotein subunit